MQLQNGTGGCPDASYLQWQFQQNLKKNSALKSVNVSTHSILIHIIITIDGNLVFSYCHLGVFGFLCFFINIFIILRYI